MSACSALSLPHIKVVLKTQRSWSQCLLAQVPQPLGWLSTCLSAPASTQHIPGLWLLSAEHVEMRKTLASPMINTLGPDQTP